MPQRPMEGKNMKRPDLFRATALGTLLAVAACSAEPGPPIQENEPARAGTTAQAVRARVPVTVTAAGTLEPAVGATLSTRVSGRVAEIPVRVGERVQAGDVVARLEGEDLLARQRQAEAGVAAALAVHRDATASFARIRNLHAAEAVSQAAFDAAEAGQAQAAQGLKAARAALAEVRAHLQYAVIRAPYDGIVTATHVDPGDLATPGAPVVGIEQPGRMRVRVALSERDRRVAAPGGRVRVEAEAGPSESPVLVVDGTVTEVGPSIDPRTRTSLVEVIVDGGAALLPSGAFVRVRFPAGEREAVLVPERAVVRRGQLEGVYVVDESGDRRLRWLRLGHLLAGGREAISGLEGGETLWVAED